MCLQATGGYNGWRYSVQGVVVLLTAHILSLPPYTASKSVAGWHTKFLCITRNGTCFLLHKRTCTDRNV